METAKDAQARTVKVALLGYGMAGSNFHAPLISSVSGMALSAIVTGNYERQAAAKKAFPDATIFSSAGALFKKAHSFDLVVVATPNDTHAPLAMEAMERNLSVVVDKPFAISTTEARSVLDVQRRTGATLSVFQNRRWDNDFLTVKKLIARDELGTVTRFESRFERFRAQPKPGGWRETTALSAGGGLLFDLGSHLIDQALVLFGEPTSVYAEMKTRRAGVLADDDTFVALQFANDVCAHIWVSLLAKIPGPRVRILGTTGAYEKYGMDPQEESLKAGLRPGQPEWGVEPREASGKLSTTGSQSYDGELISERGSYERFYELMRDAIVSGAPPPVVATDALKTLQIIEAAQLSATTRKAVAV